MTTLVPMTMLGVHVGAREDDADPIAEARESGADGVQIFLADPQGWKTPKPHPLADALRASDLDVYVHAPYVLNVATTNNRIRIPSRKRKSGAKRSPKRSGGFSQTFKTSSCSMASGPSCRSCERP